MARPKRKYLKYTKKIADAVCSEMEQGKNLITICAEYNKKLLEGEATLKPNSIHKWKRDHPEFKEQYDCAYDSRIEYLSEYIDDLAHMPTPDTGDFKRDNLELTRRKMIIDEIKFQLAKLNANRFKQVVEVEHTNAPQIVVQSWATPIEELGVDANKGSPTGLPLGDTEDDKIH